MGSCARFAVLVQLMNLLHPEAGGPKEGAGTADGPPLQGRGLPGRGGPPLVPQQPQLQLSASVAEQGFRLVMPESGLLPAFAVGATARQRNTDAESYLLVRQHQEQQGRPPAARRETHIPFILNSMQGAQRQQQQQQQRYQVFGQRGVRSSNSNRGGAEGARLCLICGSFGCSCFSVGSRLPLELDLGPRLQFHSSITCAVSKEEASRANPPRLLSCGHVVCA